MLFAEFNQKLERFFKKIEPWVGGPLLAFGYLVFCIYVPIKQRGGFANLETYSYIPAHLNFKGNFLKHIFDEHTLDSMGFQNRNLSFFVDYWDVQFLGWSLKMGYPHFLSLFHFIGVGIILFGLWRIFRDLLNLDRVVSCFLGLLILLAPVFHVTASYSRSAKIGAGIEALILAYVALLFILERASSKKQLFLCWLGAFIFSFFDMIAVSLCIYFGIVCVVFGLFQQLEFRSKKVLRAITFFGSIALVNQLFGRLALPAIQEHFFNDRYYYAKAPMGRMSEMLHHPVSWLFSVLGMFVDQVRIFFGTFPFAIAVLCVAALLWSAIDFAKIKYGLARAYIVVAAVVSPILGIWLLLKVGHEPIFHELFRRLYYPIPFQVLIAIAAGVLFHLAIRQYGQRGLRALQAFLLIAVLGAFSSLDRHIEIVRESYLSQVIAVSPKILSSLRFYIRNNREGDLDEKVRESGIYYSLRRYYDEHR